jgi:flagellar biosynthetic protein FliR
VDLSDPRLAAHALLVCGRTAGALLCAPVFGSSFLPLPLRLLIAALMGWVLALAVPPAEGLPSTAAGLAGLFAAEVAVGALLGWTAALILQGARTGGQLIDHELAFLGVRPEGEEGPTLFAGFKFMLAALIFLLINGHHLLLSGLYESFFVWRSGAPSPEQAVAFAGSALGSVFGIGLAIAAPVLLAGLLVNVGIGVLGRVMPASNLAFLALGGRTIALLLALAAAFGGIVYLLHDSIGSSAARWAEAMG